MSKKNFTGGLNSLLGDRPEKKTEGVKRIGALFNEVNEMLLAHNPDEKRGKGRPKTSTRVISKSSQEGTKENETRATFIMKEDLLDKLKAIAYWDRVMIKDVINTALSEYLTKYEKKNGEVKPITKN